MDDFETLTMTEIIRLQDQLAQTLKRRFEKALALAFTDIVDSTKYFAQHGNTAGRSLQQRHFDLLQKVVNDNHGRIVDTAGDGGFTCFPTIADATRALISLQKLISEDNAPRQREHQLVVRVGIHWGHVLTDGNHVTGEPVNLCARVATSAAKGEIRITSEAFRELPDADLRASCRALGALELKGVGRPVEVMVLNWRDEDVFPTTAVLVETGKEFKLPDQDVISFGRLANSEGGAPANDVILAHWDPALSKQISRWHFELRRHADGFVLRAVSDQITEVNGVAVEKGRDVPIRPGTIVKLGKVLTVRFESPSAFDAVSSRTEIFK